MGFRPLPWGAVILLIAARSVSAEPALHYLYIEANSGTSSGGHVAVRLDETVYHFQNKDGLILLQRDDWPRFRHLYADLDNRDIHIAKIALPESTQIEVKRHLDLFHLKQKALLDRSASLERDVELLESQTNEQPYVIPGGGFFKEKSRPQEPHSNSTRFTVNDTTESLERRRQSLIQSRKNLRYVIAGATNGDTPPASYAQSYSDLWVDLVQNEIALGFVLGQKAFNQSLLIDGGPFPLEGTQNDCSAHHWLTRYLRHLEGDAARLLSQPYPGSGLTLLRTLARMEAVRISIEKKRLYLLLPGLTSSNGEQPLDDYLGRSQHRLESEFRQHLSELGHRTFCAHEVDDLAYHRLELAALDLKEAVDANLHETPVQFDHEPILPNAPGSITTDQTEGSRKPEKHELEEAMQARDRLLMQIREKLRYNLITRNCVTELVKAVNSGFENDREPIEFQGHIDPLGSQAFIPFRFFELVLKRYPIENSTKIPSFRHRRLAQMTAQEEDGWVEIREGNTLTTTIYQPRVQDGVFLFFTDESVWSRPILGTANLGTAIVAMGFGMMSLPMDEGRLLEAGARGALFSFPEIALWNIRKGSYTEATLRN